MNIPWFGNFLPSVVLGAEIPDKRKYPTELQNLGDHLRARRHELGLTQRQAATIFGVNRVTVWYWENHRTEPEIGIYPRIVDFLGYCPYRGPRSFGELLWLHRAYRGWSKEKMAHSLGVHPGTLSQWEQGTRSPTIRSMERATAILGFGRATAEGGIPRNHCEVSRGSPMTRRRNPPPIWLGPTGSADHSPSELQKSPAQGRALDS